jgi:hypothetical protein
MIATLLPRRDHNDYRSAVDFGHVGKKEVLQKSSLAFELENL